ncbi:hypothetical protein SUDANB105_07931 [Streptomyces sp. enrichment culture]|uniref:hypothetical protein n=1 Tax=Streptomyces sp. enrichment culture TaxID=1795815 RepID=UPI003F55974C
METFWIITAADLWSAGKGLLIPRTAYRLPAQPDTPCRAACSAGHPFVGAGKGWLGRARCADGDVCGPSTPTIAVVGAMVCAALAAAT